MKRYYFFESNIRNVIILLINYQNNDIKKSISKLENYIEIYNLAQHSHPPLKLFGVQKNSF